MAISQDLSSFHVDLSATKSAANSDVRSTHEDIKNDKDMRIEEEI